MGFSNPVYEDDGAGTRAEVVLMASTVDTPSQTTPSDDLYNDIFTRHVMGGAKFGRDSAASSLSSDSGHHDGVNGEEFILGTLSVPPDISWVSMDGKVEKILAVSGMGVVVGGALKEELQWAIVVGSVLLNSTGCEK